MERGRQYPVEMAAMRITREQSTRYVCAMFAPMNTENTEQRPVDAAGDGTGPIMGPYGPARGHKGKRLPWRNDDGSRRPRGPMRDGYQQWNISAPKDLIMALKREAKARRMTATAYMLVLWETHPSRTGGGRGDGSI